MKHYKLNRRLFSLALTLSLALSLFPALTVPARAEGQVPQIIINPQSDTSTPYVSTPDDSGISGDVKKQLEERFWAYQIFKGKIAPNDYVENRDINGLGNDVQWGASIQGEKQKDLLDALKNDPTLASKLGITFALMLEAGPTYLDAANLAAYTAAYQNPNNWMPEEEGGTDGIVGGTLTADGRTALEKAFNKDLEKLTIGNLFTAALKKNEGLNIHTNGAYTASMVIADFTPNSGNAALAQAFYAIVFDRNEFSNGQVGNYKYLTTSGGKNSQGAYAVSGWESGTNSTSGYWTIGSMNNDQGNRTLDDGYYMIRDTYQEQGREGKANSAYMAGVFGYGTIYIKAEAPTVTKTFSGHGSFELGEEITFTLKGTLPENFYTAYKGYPYQFVDTMDKGMEFGAITRVYVQVYNSDGNLGPINNRYDYYLVEQNNGGYQFEKTVDGNGTKTTVTFPDLKTLKGKRVVDGINWRTEDEAVTVPADGKSLVFVQYTATLNKDANISSRDGNLNTVELHYANNPIWDPAVAVSSGTWENDWDQAPTGVVRAAARAYDFGVELRVYGKKADEEDSIAGVSAAAETKEEPLEGAAFALKKSDGDEVYYAILHRVAEGQAARAVSEKDTYYLAGWVSEEDLDYYLYGDTVAKTWDKELDAAFVENFTVPSDGSYYAAVMTQSDGLVRIVGLNSSTEYILEEVISPEGYKEMEDVTVNLNMLTDSTGLLTYLAASANGAENLLDTIFNDDKFTDGSNGELVAQLKIVNPPDGEQIVETGGMGNTLFYIGGGTLLAAAALLLVFSGAKKKSGKGEQ